VQHGIANGSAELSGRKKRRYDPETERIGNISVSSAPFSFFAPPSQWSNINGLVILDPYVVSSGALPTGYQMALGSLYGAPVFIGYMP